MSIHTRDRRKASVKFIGAQRNLFYATLKKRVDEYFRERQISNFGDSRLLVKTIILLGVYIGPLIALLILTPPLLASLGLWLLMGFGIAGLGMNVMHDANHGAYSANKTMNWCMAHVLNLIGGSTVNWKLQHNILHHTYTNITGLDDDIASKPALRLSPHADHRHLHRYQWWHAFLLYGLTTLYWVSAKDFVQFVQYRRQQINTGSASDNRRLLASLITEKMIYFSVFMILPVVVAGIPFWMVLIGFLLMHFVAGLILTVVFQLAHSLEGTSHPLPNNQGIVSNDWAIHQMNTTTNFSPHNKWLSWYVGGLNFQVEHHLFPRISHVHYPSIAPIVEATAREFDIPYLSYSTLPEALRAHIRFLKALGHPPDWKEAIG